jgi:microcystin-dependent protein
MFMRLLFFKYPLFWAGLVLVQTASVQTASAQIGIGTTTPDPNSILQVSSTSKGVLIPRLTPAQMTTLATTLTTNETGMLVTNASTGKLMGWTGTAFTDAGNLTANTPLSVSATNQVSINPGTAAGDLITWDGLNWVNMQPAPQHFTFVVSNLQPYLAMNYCIALQGIFPSRNDAVPFVSQVQLFPFNFAPTGWAMCNGQLLPISQNTALFSLVGTIYGGNGTSNFALPNLQGRVSIGFGQGPGLTLFDQGEMGGTENVTITR